MSVPMQSALVLIAIGGVTTPLEIKSHEKFDSKQVVSKTHEHHPECRELVFNVYAHTAGLKVCSSDSGLYQTCSRSDTRKKQGNLSCKSDRTQNLSITPAEALVGLTRALQA